MNATPEIDPEYLREEVNATNFFCKRILSLVGIINSWDSLPFKSICTNIELKFAATQDIIFDETSPK